MLTFGDFHQNLTILDFDPDFLSRPGVQNSLLMRFLADATVRGIKVGEDGEPDGGQLYVELEFIGDNVVFLSSRGSIIVAAEQLC